MSAKLLRTANRKVTLDARPDRPDIRDRIYQPPLVSLPPQSPTPDDIKKYFRRYRDADLVLNQGQEGACTGFGLACVINYLLFRKAVLAKKRKLPEPVSTRMIYHLARKYDEWPGEDYEGSSCRGAMKGWFHHGVCSEEIWPYRNKKGEAVFVPPQPNWAVDAAQRPLGAYYRIYADVLADLQAAIYEVGAVYVSSDVHKGWDKVPTTKKDIPTIEWKPQDKPDGGHAYALVGYDDHGFIVQNSWGPDWGYHGFARLTYDDWLEHGDDAWVAVMGAPIAARSPTIVLSSRRTLTQADRHLTAGLANGVTAELVAESPREGAWETTAAVNHAIVLGNDGLPDHITIEDANSAASVERVAYELPKAWFKNPRQGGRRIVIYAHGGLNDLAAGINRIKVMGPWFDQNGIYPIFTVWQSGYFDSIKDIISDKINEIVSETRDRKMLSLIETARDARDYLLELSAIPAARPVWSQMKQNAIAASNSAGGMAMLANCLVKLKKDFKDLEIHLVGHSAGALMHGAFLNALRDRQLTATTLSLYAPACTVEFANSHYLPAAMNKVVDPKRVAIDILSDKYERDDTVGPYGKSLLYLVSRALEATHKTPILGMEAVWNPQLDKDDIFATKTKGRPNEHVTAWRNGWLKLSKPAQVLAQDRVLEERPNFTIRSVHGCFDNWIDGVERTIQRILDLSTVNKLPTRITSLRGF